MASTDTRTATSAEAIRDLRAVGPRPVLLTGDNQAAVLAQADLGLAMGTGTDAAIEASDLTLVRGDLRAAVDAIRLARRTWPPSKAPCSGPSPITSRPYRWPRSACSTP